MILIKDGKKLITGYGNSILFISLPDLEIIGCAVDTAAMKDTMQGIEYSKTDPVSGFVYTVTLPEGAEIPSGAVCTCNSLTGKVSTACTCDGYKCSCDAPPFRRRKPLLASELEKFV